MEPVRLAPPLVDVKSLRAGGKVLITGLIYTARDAAHRRLIETLKQGGEPPLDLNGAVIYYAGPTPTRPGEIIGSVGPTTASRMDPFTDDMFAAGVKVVIGKGPRGEVVREACKRRGAVYLATVGGMGVYLARCVRKVDIVAYEELGTEAIRRLEVEDFPATVAIDSEGEDIFVREKLKYRTI